MTMTYTTKNTLVDLDLVIIIGKKLVDVDLVTIIEKACRLRLSYYHRKTFVDMQNRG